METQKYCTIYIVRHGETENNIKDIVQGHIDSPLTKLGEDQAIKTSQILKEVNFDAVFSSDLTRAIRTAELITLDRNLAVNTNRLIREQFNGKFEGVSGKLYNEQKELLKEQQKIITEQQKRSFKIEPAAESLDETAARLLRFLREIAVSFLDKTVLVVSHGAAMRAMLMHLGFGTFDELPHHTVANAGYIKLESDDVDFFIKETKGVNKIKV